MHFERVGILVNINMFDSLLHRNTKLEFEPSLATSWKALSDTQWEFKLRKGVRFHNNEIMTAEDVKYSFERVLDQKKKSPQYGNIRAIKEVRAVDPETVHIITDKPFPLLLERLVFFSIVPKKHVEAVEAARAIGASPARMVLRHLLPNTFSSIIVMSTLQVAQAILQEAALSFLGVGTGSAYPTWGQMIALGRDFVSVAWWLPTFPGLAILLTVLAINLVGDRLRDALDPRVG